MAGEIMERSGNQKKFTEFSEKYSSFEPLSKGIWR